MGKGRHFLQLLGYELALFYPRLSNGRVGRIGANHKRTFRPDSTLNYLVSFWADFKIIIDSKSNGCAIPSHSRKFPENRPFETSKKTT